MAKDAALDEIDDGIYYLQTHGEEYKGQIAGLIEEKERIINERAKASYEHQAREEKARNLARASRSRRR